MGALNFLDLGPLPDALRAGVTHNVGLYRQGDGIFLKLTLAAPTGNQQAYCQDGSAHTGSIITDVRLSMGQLNELEQAIANAKGSIRA